MSELLDDVIRNSLFAADRAVIEGTFRTHADVTRAAVKAAFELAAGNGLIRLVPQKDWPEWIRLDPPYDRVPMPSGVPSPEPTREGPGMPKPGTSDFDVGVEAAARAIEEYAESVGWCEDGRVWADAIAKARSAAKAMIR